MASLTAHITTFNCGRSLPSTSHLASSLFENTSTTLPPDLIVLCLQEIAPIGYAFLGGSFLAPYFGKFSTIVQNAVSQHFDSNTDYAPLVVQNAGLTALMVFARSDVQDSIRWIETAAVGVGMYELGNKGAIGARLYIDGDDNTPVPMTFVSAHLAPMEDQCERRNADWKSICEGLVFTRVNNASKPSNTTEDAQPLLHSPSPDTSTTSSPSTLFSPLSHTFFAGDLNYRTADTAPSETDHKLWPHPTSSPSHPSWRDLWANDQLNRELRAQNTLHLLAEAPVAFPPTYKYSSAAQKAAANGTPLPSGGEDGVWPWAKHRVPSWCDRVLFLAGAKPEVQRYAALPVQPTSDHRPVTSVARVPLRRPRKEGDVKVPFRMRKDWRERRAVARRYEVLVGVGAYLALTWEGEAMLLATVVGVLGGYVALRAVLAG